MWKIYPKFKEIFNTPHNILFFDQFLFISSEEYFKIWLKTK